MTNEANNARPTCLCLPEAISSNLGHSGQENPQFTIPTQRLLALLSRPSDLSIRLQLENLSEESWDEVIQLSYWHGISPLLYERVAVGAWPMRIPGTVLQTLREAYLMNSVRNRFLYQELTHVLKHLQEHRIPVIVLKGAHLAASIYGDIALRPMSDIDLLVSQNNLAIASAALTKLGYAVREPGAETNYHSPPLFKSPGFRIELHWTLTGANELLTIDLRSLWDRARLVPLAGGQMRVLSPEDLLLHLCIHAGAAGHHAFSLGLRPLYDIATVILHFQMELAWQLVQSRTKEWQANEPVYLTLRLSRELLNSPVPEGVLRSLRPADFDHKKANLAKARVLSGTERTDSEDEFTLLPWSFLENLCGPARLRDKIQYVLKVVFPSRKHMALYMASRHAVAMTPIRNFTCYLSRMIDLLIWGTRLAWRSIACRGETPVCVQKLRGRISFQRWMDDSNLGNRHF